VVRIRGVERRVVKEERGHGSEVCLACLAFNLVELSPLAAIILAGRPSTLATIIVEFKPEFKLHCFIVRHHGRDLWANHDAEGNPPTARLTLDL
jgi:hypothetical protein